ncbi:MAG: hypothetical protein U1A77_25065 [Pirellulales bacterium]
MPVHCAACGEELLGAVNRCWRCGRSFAHAPTPESEPPVRGPAIPDWRAIPPGRQGTMPASLAHHRGVLVDDEPPAVVAALSSDSDQRGSPETPAEAPLGEGVLRAVDLSVASHLGSPFRDDYRISWRERARLWFRVPREWWRQANNRMGSYLRRRSADESDAAGPAAAGPAVAAARQVPGNNPGQAAKGRPVPVVTPLRAALADSSLALAVLLGIVSLALLSYPLIAILIAGLGLAMALASLAARIRGRTLLAVFLCLAPLFVLAAREYQAWRAAQAQAEADLFDE